MVEDIDHSASIARSDAFNHTLATAVIGLGGGYDYFATCTNLSLPPSLI